MAKTRTTVTLDEEVLKAVKLRAARQGRRESEVIESALRDSLLMSPLEKMWAKVDPMPEDEAMELALQEQKAARAQLKRERKKQARANAA
jgi:Ribbon-helix-helix protein, copG family